MVSGLVTWGSHELDRAAGQRHETRLERTPRRSPINLNKKRKIDNNGVSHRIHARSFRRRHSSGGLHAVLPGDRLCGR